MKKAGLTGNSRGFTLIELMVVVTIIGILTAVAVPQFARQAGKARVKAAVADIISIKNAVDMYIAENAVVPTASDATTDGGTSALGDVLNDAGINWSTLRDPWGNGYRYAVDGDNYTIDSAGPDGVFGGDDADDIVATQSKQPESGQKAVNSDTGDFISGE